MFWLTLSVATVLSLCASVVLLDASTCYYIGHPTAPPSFDVGHENPLPRPTEYFCQVASTRDCVVRLTGSVQDLPGLFIGNEQAYPYTDVKHRSDMYESLKEY